MKECKLTCGEFAQLWPRPNGKCELSKVSHFANLCNPKNSNRFFSFYILQEVSIIDPDKITLTFGSGDVGNTGRAWLQESVDERILWLKDEAEDFSQFSKLETQDEEALNLEILVNWTDPEEPPSIKVRLCFSTTAFLPRWY